MNILFVNSVNAGGGASGYSSALIKQFRSKGHHCDFIVGKLSEPNHEDGSFIDLAYKKSFIKIIIKFYEYFFKRLDWLMGFERYKFPSSHYILSIAKNYDVIHLNNLHGNYFDLRILPKLSKLTPTVVSLHDCWIFTGHCAHPFDCHKFQIECGKCPNLKIPPSIAIDNTQKNLTEKVKILQSSKLAFIANSDWLLRKFKSSKIGLEKIEVIHPGIDLNFFKRKHPLPKKIQNITISFMAVAADKNPFKDYETIFKALKKINPHGHSLMFQCIGSTQDLSNTLENGVLIKHIKFQSKENLKNLYENTDIYIHSSQAESFGLAITEAMGLGCAILASDVGGIKEQLNHIHINKINLTGTESFNAILFDRGKESQLANALECLLTRPELITSMRINSLKQSKYFSIESCAASHLKLYENITVN